jgi:hypothetical protein
MWKPQPAHLVGAFSPEKIKSYLQHTVDAAIMHGCTLEIVLLDTHTCEFHSERFDQWTRIAKDIVEQ